MTSSILWGAYNLTLKGFVDGLLQEQDQARKELRGGLGWANPKTAAAFYFDIQ
jgi:hypothetical protein